MTDDITESCFPSKKIFRWGHACARVGSTVVIAGGVSINYQHCQFTCRFSLGSAHKNLKKQESSIELEYKSPKKAEGLLIW